jgi:hypothetical protein
LQGTGTSLAGFEAETAVRALSKYQEIIVTIIVKITAEHRRIAGCSSLQVVPCRHQIAVGIKDLACTRS